jgi:hypothetical protein
MTDTILCYSDYSQEQSQSVWHCSIIGKVIGNGWKVIKKISEVNNVRMTVGKWCEQDRENRSDLNVVFYGVLIKDESNDAKKAIQSVNDILADSTKEEPLEKKNKF